MSTINNKLLILLDDHRQNGGKPLRNTEIVTVRNGKIVEVEVYFGWSIPHEAPAGGFVDL